MRVTPTPTEHAAAGTVVQPSASICAAESLAPTHTMPVRRTVDVASERPGLRDAITEAGAALAATLPSTMLTGIAEICSEDGNWEATTVAALAVATAAARPGPLDRAPAMSRAIIHLRRSRCVRQRVRAASATGVGLGVGARAPQRVSGPLRAFPSSSRWIPFMRNGMRFHFEV
jgi:hypothetical protein